MLLIIVVAVVVAVIVVAVVVAVIVVAVAVTVAAVRLHSHVAPGLAIHHHQLAQLLSIPQSPTAVVYCFGNHDYCRLMQT